MVMRKKSRVTKKKTVDLPPKGRRNRDPISGARGAHPVEAGAGALVGGAAAGLGIGALGGPVGAVIGATVGGALAGGLGGKVVGEAIDPTAKKAKLVSKKTIVRAHVRKVKAKPKTVVPSRVERRRTRTRKVVVVDRA